ncbi:MAG TPA: hypothetical protein VNG12_24050 [Acidimicrobiales bacterium]|nr:hypothetical protein [Acidimicrobiales bacterium]
MSIESAAVGCRRLLVVYPPLGNRFYCELAIRLSKAASALDNTDTNLISAADLGACDTGWIRGATALVVNPVECALSGRRVLSPLKASRFRAAVLAECVETRWFRDQFGGDIDYQAVIDVGFVDQGSAHPFPTVPYRFLFNAPLADESEVIAAMKPKYPRPLTWALVAARTDERVRFAEELHSILGPEGFLFMPDVRPVRPGAGMLSPSALKRTLDQTTFYVWRSHHGFPYYESFRFMDAVLSGSIPCKIDSRTSCDPGGLPHTYGSVESLADEADERPTKEMYEEHREFALAHGSLDDRLRELIRDV